MCLAWHGRLIYNCKSCLPYIQSILLDCFYLSVPNFKFNGNLVCVSFGVYKYI